ncbi:MAG: hypothetical protein ABIR06_07890 [Cyclobacteriaceae bacterium]
MADSYPTFPDASNDRLKRSWNRTLKRLRIALLIWLIFFIATLIWFSFTA